MTLVFGAFILLVGVEYTADEAMRLLPLTKEVQHADASD